MSNIPSVIRNASLDELRRIARRYPRDLATYQANEWYWFTRLGHPLVHTVTTGNFFAQTSNHPKALTEEELKRLTSADLAVLALSASKTARIAAAEHADTPPATLSELAEDPEREVRRATGWNNATPPETIVRMERMGRTDEISDWRLRLLWTELESVPLDEDVALDVARGNYYDANRLGLARRKYVPSKLLTTLANYYKLDSETADVLAECRIRDVRRALAANDLGQFGTAVLARLAGDDDSEVRIAAGSNRRLPSEALAKLLDDPNAHVRHEVTIAGSIEDDVLKEMDQNSARRPSLQARIIAGRGSEQLLRDLSVSPHPGTRAAVAQNTSTPMDVLEVLAEDDEQVVTQAVAHGLGFEVANRLFRDAYNLTEIWWYRRQLNKEDFQALLTSSSPRLRALVAQRHIGWFKPGDLTKLAGDPDPQVRIAAATNPQIDFNVFTPLLDDDDPAVRQATKRLIVDWLRDLASPKPEPDDSWLTQLEELPSELPRLYGGGLDRGGMYVGHLSHSSWWVVGWEGIDVLARSDDPEIRAAVAGFAGEHHEEGKNSWLKGMQATLTEKTLLRLLADANETVRKAALGNEGPTAIAAASDDQVPIDALVHYARSRSAALRAATAANPMTPGPVLANLARDSYDAVRVTVAGNPSTPKDALAILTKDAQDKVVLELLGNPNTPSHFLITQANRDSDSGDRRRHERLANNPSAEAEVLRKVAFSNWDHVREAVAAHPATPADTIEILSFDESPRVRAAVGRRNT